MEVFVRGGSAFSHLVFTLAPGEEFVTTPGAMASMDNGPLLYTRLNGGLFNALFLKLFGKESLFLNTIRNTSKKVSQVVIAGRLPGEIVKYDLKNGALYIQAGSFICGGPGVKLSASFAGIHSWLAGEGFFRLKIKGRGEIWFGAFGGVVQKDVNSKLVVDGGFLLAYPPSIKLKTQFPGRIFSTLFSGEGLVTRLEGKGKVYLQTRCLKGLANWINPRFWR